MSDYGNFQRVFGCTPPRALLRFLENRTVQEAMPASFRIKDAAFNLDIQYLLNVDDPANFRAADRKLAIAVTTDGHDLIVDIDDADLTIYQDEFGDVDSLNVTIHDLRRSVDSRLE